MSLTRFWPRTISEWMYALAAVCLPLGFIFNTKMFFVAVALMALGFMTAVALDKANDLRNTSIRKHPVLALLDFVYQGGAFLAVAVMLYFCVGELVGVSARGRTAARLMVVGVYLVVGCLGVLGFFLAGRILRAEPSLLARYVRERNYPLIAVHTLLVALSSSIAAVLL